MNRNIMLAHALASIAMTARASDDAVASGTTTGTQAIVIQGYDFTIPAPYGEGHALTANEAAAMNQLYAENIRNNSASKIKTAKAEAEKAGVEFSVDTFMVGEGDEAVTLRAAIDEYAANYEFGARRTSSKEPVDPIQREAYRIAKEVVNSQLAAKGIKQKNLAEGVYDDTVERVKGSDRVQKLAAKRVKEREALAGDELDIGDLETKPEAEDGAEQSEGSVEG